MEQQKKNYKIILVGMTIKQKREEKITWKVIGLMLKIMEVILYGFQDTPIELPIMQVKVAIK